MRTTRLPAILLAALATAASTADRIDRRGGAPALEGEILRIDDAGVELRSDLGALHRVSWDRVRHVATARRSDDLAGRIQTATDLWRARTRVERYDFTLAEPILERMFPALKGQTHETALVVAEGLLRCRLARGANAQAVIPALEMIRLRRAGVTSDSYSSLEPVFDETYDLCPQLPPFWLEDLALRGLARELQGSQDDDGDEVVRMLAGLLRNAIEAQTPVESGGEEPDRPSMSSGIELLNLIVRLLRGDPDAEQRTEMLLRRSGDDRPAWVEAWLRFAMGTALQQAPGEGRRQRGMLSLAHVAVRFGDEQPYLAGLALARMSDALAAQGRLEKAQSIQAELATRFPTHPARRLGRAIRLEEDHHR